MHIRRARPEEAGTLGAIALSAKASWGYAAADLAAWRDDLSPSAESVRVRPTYLVEVDGELAGFYQLDLETRPVELEHLWVRPDSMRRGLGRALLVHALQVLAEAGIASLAIDSDPHAEAFYLACGAVRVGERAAPLEGQPDRVRPQLLVAS